MAYVDVSGEPKWVRYVCTELNAPAPSSEESLVLRARPSPTLRDLLATELSDRVRIAIVYEMHRYRPSMASVRSALEIAASGELIRESGTSLQVTPGGRTRRFGKGWGALFPIHDPDVLVHYVDAQDIGTFMLAPRATRVVAADYRISGGPESISIVRVLTRVAVLERRRDTSGRIDVHIIVEGTSGRGAGSIRANNVYSLTSVVVVRSVIAALGAQADFSAPAQLLSFGGLGTEIRVGLTTPQDSLLRRSNGKG